MGQERLTYLAILYIQRDIEVNKEEIINLFSDDKNHRTNLL